MELNRDWFTARLSYTRSNYEVRDRASGAAQVLFDGSTKASQSFYGLALNGDWDEWQLRSEFGKAARMNAVGYDASFNLVTLGRQFGAFTVTAGMSSYRESSRFTPDEYAPLKLNTRQLTLRYELHKGGALKAQIDAVRDRSNSTFSGNARVLSVAYDLVF